jgi:hypothetical protein
LRQLERRRFVGTDDVCADLVDGDDRNRDEHDLLPLEGHHYDHHAKRDTHHDLVGKRCVSLAGSDPRCRLVGG